MTNRVLQRSFTGGEIAPQLMGRVDDSAYQAGGAKIDNWIIEPTGALRSRSGFRFVGEVSNSQYPHRLIPFRYSSDQTLMLVFGHYNMRICHNGGYVLNGNGSIYQIETKFSAADLFDIDYSQNADVLTLCCNRYKPTELRRYGATDWRFVDVTTAPTIQAPSSLTASAVYPSEMTEAEEGQQGKITATYVATAIDENGMESRPTNAVTVQCNYYITGASVKVSWSAVSNAKYYRVYRLVAGIYGFIGQTNQGELSLSDTGMNPDTTTTPPMYDEPFSGSISGSVSSISVTNGGEGYGIANYDNTISLPSTLWLDALPLVFDVDSDTTAVTYTVSVVSDGAVRKSWTVNSEVVGSVDGNTIYQPVMQMSGAVATPLQLALGSLAGGHLIAPSIVVSVNHGTFLFAPTSNQRELIQSSALARYILTYNDIALFRELGNGVTYYQDFMTLFRQRNAAISLPVTISDSSGSGASATAYATNGVITNVVVNSGGSGYVSPAVVVSATSGSGAQFTANLSGENDTDYPSTVSEYDQRRVFAGSNKHPLKAWFTNAGHQSLMMYHMPVKSDDCIDIEAASSDADRIRHAVALESLLLFTSSSELRVYTQNSDMLSPNTVAVKKQSAIGANNIQPVIANATILYAAARGGHMRGLGYDYTISGYNTQDICIRSPHLFDGKTIKDFTFALAPVQILWVANSDGELISCTYYPEQQVIGWSRHTVLGKVESVCAIAEDTEDHLYIITNNNGHRYIQRLSKLMVNQDDPLNYRFMDCYLDGIFTNAISHVTGLNHLEGQTVNVWVDGKQQTSKTVSNGEIYLDSAGHNVAVGLPLTSTLVTLPLTVPNAEALTLGRVRNISEVFLRVSGSGNVKAGNYPRGNIYPCKKTDLYIQPQQEDSYIVKVSLDGEWSYGAQIKVEHDDCRPLNLSNVIGNVTVEGGK